MLGVTSLDGTGSGEGRKLASSHPVTIDFSTLVSPFSSVRRSCLEILS